MSGATENPISHSRLWLIVTILVVAFVTGFFGGYLYLGYAYPKKNDLGERPKFDIEEPVVLSDSKYNFLLLGYGGEGHDGGALSDVLMVASLDTQNKTIKTISVPRDLWVDIPVRSDLKEKHKINSAFAIGSSDNMYPLKETQYKGENGGGKMAKAVVEDVTGIKIDNYLAINFGNFKKVIDVLGGVEVEVPQTFSDNFYPVKGLENETCGFSPEQILEFHQKYSGFDLEKQFTCRYETLSFTKGKVKMDGETALKYVRSRHSDTYGGDFSRSERQQSLMVGVSKKLVSMTAVKSAKEIYQLFSGLLQTDVDMETFGGFFLLIGDPSTYQSSFTGLSTENVLMNSKSADGQFILIPKSGENSWTEVRDFVSSQI